MAERYRQLGILQSNPETIRDFRLTFATPTQVGSPVARPYLPHGSQIEADGRSGVTTSATVRRWFLGATLLIAGFGDLHPAVLTSISIDGNVSDWSAVLADNWQRTLDGPAGGLPDLDAPVQSTGRDLTAFAWTYDSAYFYMYLSRTGSSSNKQLFWYYLDLNFDERMQSGEPVFHVAWWGNSRKTITYLYTYNAVSAGGDAMVDGGDMADGWTMPGTLSGGTQIETVTGGAGSGIEMESRVSWSQLGVPAGTPFHFHVSSSNSNNLPSQVDDNLGGPGGSIGTTALTAVVFTPDRNTSAIPGGNAVLSHRVENGGSAADTFDLTWTSTGFAPGSVGFYLDGDGDARLGPGDLLLTDTGGSASPDTGLLTVGASLDLLVVIAVPAGLVEGDAVTVTATATSSLNPLATDDVVDAVVVASPGMTLVKMVDRTTAAPNELLTYTILYTSAGSAAAYNPVLIDPVPPQTVYESGSATGGVAVEFSHDGGLTFDASDVTPVTHVRWRLTAPLAPGAGGMVSFGARVR